MRKSKTRHIPKKKIIGFSICILAILCVSGFGMWKTREAKGSMDTVEIKAGMGEEILCGELTAVRGNEISGSFAEEVQEEGVHSYDGKSYKATGQEESILIPVGTQVVTKLGMTTTFSRLAAGDFVAILRDKSTGEIIEVYIIG